MRRLYLFVFLFCVGCMPYKVPTSHYSKDIVCKKNQAKAHWLYSFVPRHRHQLYWCDLGHWTTWALFGNDDDGIFGEGCAYQPRTSPSFCKALSWGIRNPLHNFCFYVIGSAHTVNSRVTLVRLGDASFEAFRYYPHPCPLYGGEGTSFLFALHGWKPFISFKLAFSESSEGQFYLGWRERGNFGLKFHPFVKRSVDSSSHLD